MAKKEFDATTSTVQHGTRRLEEIQQQMNDMGLSESLKAQVRAPYDEFYKSTTRYGFTRITIPASRKPPRD